MANTRPKCQRQLEEYSSHKRGPETLATSLGHPIDDKLATMTVGPRGGVVLEDFVFLDEMAHFDHERIPERVVHAKGAGAFGYFEVTHDITQYSKAKVFSQIGKRTPLAVRFSLVGGERGSADTVRDPRGFAVKFYTEDGIWDLVGNNTPIFFIRDPIFFPSFIHSQKRNPVTNLKDPDMFWDFISLRPESTHQVSFLFSDRGIPDGFRHMHGHGSNTFKLVNSNGNPVYCKFHYKTDQGIKNLPVDQAIKLAGENPDYATEDLYESIANGKFPSWTMYIQVMTFEQAEKLDFNPFDVTKIWPHAEFPLIPVGKLVLDRNPRNFFAEVEQLAFCVSHMPSGIEASPDKMLQGRLFSYSDTHRHRLGPNSHLIPVNSAHHGRPHNYQRDGPMCTDGNQGDAPNYFPNSFHGPVDNPAVACSKHRYSGDVQRYRSDDEDNFTQAGFFYRKVLTADQRTRLVENIAGHVRHAAPFIQERVVKNFTQADPEYGSRIAQLLKQYREQEKK